MRGAVREEQWRQQVRTVAKYYGWDMNYHTHDSRRSDAGWPDEVFAKPKIGRCVFVELKSDTGRLRPQQEMWLNALDAAGLETGLWRPSDMETVRAVLGPRQSRSNWKDYRPTR